MLKKGDLDENGIRQEFLEFMESFDGALVIVKTNFDKEFCVFVGEKFENTQDKKMERHATKYLDRMEIKKCPIIFYLSDGKI